MSKKKKEFLEIERDEDFVHRGKLRSGWEETHKSLTDYLMGSRGEPKSAEKQVKEIYQLCRNRADNMGTEIKHQLHFSPKEETGHTDGKKVFVSTKVLDEPKSFSEKSDIMLGIVTHEMAHIIHTDFDMMKKELKNRFTHSIWNTIEDERIEHAVGEEYPGYAGNLKVVKEYFFNEKYLLEEALKKGKKLEPTPEEKDGDIPEHLKAEDPREHLTSTISDKEKDAMELYDLVFKYIRYPMHIDPEIAGKHEVALDDIKAILTPYPVTAKEAIDASKKVAKVISDKIEEEDETPTDRSESEAIKEMISTMMDEEGSVNEDDDPIESESLEKYDYTEKHIEDEEWKATFRKGVDNAPMFKKYLSEVKGDARRLADVLFVKTYNETKYLRGMRSGDLDDAKIIEAVHGVKTVHLLKTPKVSKKMSLCLLIDESGSMGYGTKERDAAKVAILIQEAFRIFPIGDLFIYGFTGDYGEDFNTIFRYKEPGLELPYGLGSVRGRSENRDGHCIRAVANRVRTFTKEPMLYFVISDGQPSASYYNGHSAMMDTRKAVEEVTKKKFFPIQIGIGGGISEREQKIMFNEYVNYSSSAQMVSDMRKLLLNKAHKFIGI
jgi:hypothetical protein